MSIIACDIFVIIVEWFTIVFIVDGDDDDDDSKKKCYLVRAIRILLDLAARYFHSE
jgi:hypothetical protein